MLMRDGLAYQGRWLFRWRGWLPVLLLPLFALSLTDFNQIERSFGGSAQLAWQTLCLAVTGLGLMMRCLTVGYVPSGTSGRNASQQKADFLNTTGMYSMVRHPLYVANFLGVLGLVMYTQSAWLTLVVGLIYWMHYERIIMAEEAFLLDKFGDSYRKWADATPALVPNVRRFTKATLAFSSKSVLSREYPTLLSTLVAFAFVDLVGHWRTQGVPLIDTGWVVAVIAGALIAVALRTFKKSGALRTNDR